MLLEICSQLLLERSTKETPNLQKFVAHIFIWVFLLLLDLIFLTLFGCFPFHEFVWFSYFLKVQFFGPHINPQQRDGQIKHNLLEEPALPLYSESVYFMFHFMLHSSCLENRVNKLLAK